MNRPRSHRTRKPGRRRRRGAALVEAGISLALLLTLVFGCLDFGRFAYSYIVLTNSLRTGAGVGATRPVSPSTQAQWEAAVQTAIVDELQSVANFDANNLVVATPVVTKVPGGTSRLRLEASYPFKTIVNWPFISNEVTMWRAVEMPFIR